MTFAYRLTNKCHYGHECSFLLIHFNNLQWKHRKVLHCNQVFYCSKQSSVLLLKTIKCSNTPHDQSCMEWLVVNQISHLNVFINKSIDSHSLCKRAQIDAFIPTSCFCWFSSFPSMHCEFATYFSDDSSSRSSLVATTAAEVAAAPAYSITNRGSAERQQLKQQRRPSNSWSDDHQGDKPAANNCVSA